MHQAAHWFRQRAWSIPERGAAVGESHLNAALLVAVVMHALVMLAVIRLPDTAHAPLEVELLSDRAPAREQAAMPAAPPEVRARPEAAPAPPALPARAVTPPPAMPRAMDAPSTQGAPQAYTPLFPSRISGEQARAGLGAPVLPPIAADRAGGVPAGPVTAPASPDARPGRSAPAPALPDNTAAVRAGYQEALRVSIDRHKEYPLFARKARQEGRCVVVCEIARDGTVRDVRLAKESGHSQLDRAAVRAVGDVGRFPPVPPELKGETLSFEVPVSFRLSAD